MSILPVDPPARDSVDQSQHRRAESQYAYTFAKILEWQRCERCGHFYEHHILGTVSEQGEVAITGGVTACPRCDSEHWLFKTHGLRANARRRLGAKTVV